MPAQVVFANACLSLKFGVNLLGNGFAVSQRFLDGWAAAYIASPLLKAGLPMENLLFHHLVDAGLPLGDAVAVVNENIARIGLEAPAFTVVGDVEATYGNAGLTEPQGTSAIVRDGHAVIELTATMPRFAAVSIADDALLHQHRAGTLEVVPDPPLGGRPYFYAGLHDAGDRLQVLVCGARDVPITEPGNRRHLMVRPRRAGADVDGLLPAIRRYESLADMDLKLPQAKSALTELASMLPTVARRAGVARADLTESAAIAKSVDRFWSTFDQLDKDLLALLLKLTETRSYHFVEAYRPTYLVDDVRSADLPCPYCGEVVYEYQHRHVLRQELRRVTHSCPVCGAIRDFDDDELTLDVDGEPAITPGAANLQRIRMTNRRPFPVRLHIGARVSKGAKDGFRFELERDLVTLAPQETTTVPMRVVPGMPQVKHAVLLRVYAVSAGRIYFAGRDLWFAFTPKTILEPTREDHHVR